MCDKIKIPSIPRDSQVMLAIINEMGMSEYDPRAVNQLTEYVYKYVSTVLEEARNFFNNTNRKFMDVEDIQAALHVINERGFISNLPREVSSQYISAINNTPLPPVNLQNGLCLPRHGIKLTNPNYILKKEPTKKSDVEVLPGLNVIKPKVTFIKRVTTASPAVAHQQSVMVPSAEINLMPKFNIKTQQVPTTNGTLKRKRQND